MPTDIHIQYVACHLVADSDPQAWICSYRLTDPATDEVILAETNFTDPTPAGDALADWATDNDYTIA
jgi:hypothetical protein